MKTKNKAKILHFDLYGKREDKYDFLDNNSLESIEWTELDVKKPNFFFVYKDLVNSKIYNSYIDLRKLFIKNSMGIATGNDKQLVALEKELILNKYNSFNKFYYRPFDIRFTIFDNNILQRARFKLMSNLLKNNLALNIVRQSKQKGLETLITNNLTNRDFITNHTYTFPLYLYPDSDSQQTIEKQPERVPNFNMEIVKEIAKKLELEFKDDISTPLNAQLSAATERSRSGRSFAPIDILDYIYAVLHSPTYREKYKEFLKIDFPRVPYPKDKEVFWQLVKLGGEIRQIHLLESSVVEEYITTYPMSGSNEVTRKLTLRSPGFVPTNEG